MNVDAMPTAPVAVETGPAQPGTTGAQAAAEGDAAVAFAAVLRALVGEEATGAAAVLPMVDLELPTTDDAGQALAAELLLASFQRLTSTGLGSAATAGTDIAGTTATGAEAGIPQAAVLATTATGLPVEGAADTDAAAPDGTAEDGLLDLSGMTPVADPETTVDLTTADHTPGGDAAAAAADAADAAGLAAARAATTAAAAAAAAVAPSGSGDRPATELTTETTVDTAIDLTTGSSATAATTAATRADGIVGSEVRTIRADQLQRAIADTARQLADQGGGSHRITVRIDPPDLGQVTIEVVTRGNEVRVSLHASDGTHTTALHSQQRAISEALSAEGFNLQGFDVQTGLPEDRRRDGEDRRGDGRVLDVDIEEFAVEDDGVLRI